MDEELYEGISKVCVSVYSDAKTQAAELQHKEGRHVYITPYTYLEHLKNFQDLYNSKSSYVNGLADRYDNSINILETTKSKLKKMQTDLEINQNFM